MNEDFADLIVSLLNEGVRFMVVGAHAMAVHGVPRSTGDIDIWISSDEENAASAFRALARFGAPLSALGIASSDFSKRDNVIQIGLPPRRIDVLTGISGAEFEGAWLRRTTFQLGALTVPVLGRTDLIASKRAAGRPKDIADLAVLDPESK